MKSDAAQRVIDERLFRLLVASIKDYAIFMIDPRGLILSWNQGAENIKGYNASEITGKHISTFYTEDDNAAGEPMRNLGEALKHGRFENEGWRVRRNGNRFWANVIITPLFDEENNHVGFAKITRDITDRKLLADHKQLQQAELEQRVKQQTQKILAGELRFRMLIENSYDGISLLDPDFKVFYRSKSAERINGWNDEERILEQMDYFIHPEDHAILEALKPKILASPEKPWLIVFRSKHRLGHYIWVECLFTNMLENEFIKAVVCNFRDITQVKEQHERLIEATDTQLAILNALPPHVALLNETGHILTVNDAWKKFASANRLSLPDYGLGSNYLSVCEQVSGADRKAATSIVKGIKSVIIGARQSYVREYSCYSAREQHWFQLIAAPLNSKRLKGVVVLHINITEKKQAELLLINSKEEISKQNIALKDIAWISSHEVRRPVASILGLINLIKMADTMDEKDELIGMIDSCANELDQLVHHIHDRINKLDA